MQLCHYWTVAGTSEQICYLGKGTEWIKHADIDETITSTELKNKPKPANVSGLQMADLLAYPLYRYSLKFFKLKDDGRETFNEQIIEVIKPKNIKGGNTL